MGFKPPEEKKAGAPEWMVTYTDLMSLLMVFFILLLTFSTPRMEKLFELQGSISGSFGIVMGHPDDRESEVEPSHLLLGRDLRNPYAPATPPRFLPMEQRDPNVDLSRLKDQTGEAIAFETIAEMARDGAIGAANGSAASTPVKPLGRNGPLPSGRALPSAATFIA